MGLRKNLRKLTERKRLGEILVEMKLLTDEQLNVALDKAKKANVLLGNFLLSEGIVSEEQMAQALANQFGLRSVDLRQWEEIDPAAIKMVPEAVARKHQIIPLKVENETLILAVQDPLSLVNLASVPELAGRMIMPMVATPSQLKVALDRIFKSESDTKLIEKIASNLQQRSDVVVPIRQQRIQAPAESLSGEKLYSIEGLLNKIIEKAIDCRASDVHFEPLRDAVRVRQRVDGILQEAQMLPLDIYPSIGSRIKILGQMDIAERRQPQDGHFQMRINMRDVDFRVSTLPTVHGEKTVLRILDKGAQRATLAETGMNAALQAAVKKLVQRPFGIVLVTGPTGSGKTTTVYSMIREIDKRQQNVVTIEDPVEFEIDDVNQVQVNQKANVHFANTLRSVLRQDPDVIMVGEIRDQETADIAIRSALTGHLVISTIHTNNAAGTLSRLVEMGVEPYLVSSSLAGVLSQRLVRKVCPHCRVAYKITDEERALLGADLVPAGALVYKHAGCANCNGIGFSGRVGIFEYLELDDELRRLIGHGQVDEGVAAHLRATGFRTLRMDGVQKLLEGLTTVEEVLSETV